MMARGCDIIGLPIICLEEGCKVLEVKDIIYCKKSFKIIAFLIDEGGYFHEARIISFEKVKNIGKEAITIQNKDCIEKLKGNLEELNSREKLLGLEVITDDGKNVGVIQDVMVDIPTGRLLGLILTEGIFDDLVDGRPILPLYDSLDIHESMLVISKRLNASILHNTGGLKKLFS